MKNLYILFGLLVIFSCGNSSWENTQEQGTIEAYEKFITENPENENIKQAQQTLDSLINVKDDEDWTIAMQANTLESIEKYINDYPGGIYIRDATERYKEISEELAADSLWQKALKENTHAIYIEYYNRFPKGKNIDEAYKKVTETAQNMFKNELNQIVDFYAEKYETSNTKYFSKKACKMLLSQPTAEGNKESTKKSPYNDEELDEHYGHWELRNQMPEMDKMLQKYINEGETEGFKFEISENIVVLNFSFCPGGFCYEMDFTWEKENNEFVLTRISISLPSYM